MSDLKRAIDIKEFWDGSCIISRSCGPTTMFFKREDNKILQRNLVQSSQWELCLIHINYFLHPEFKKEKVPPTMYRYYFSIEERSGFFSSLHAQKYIESTLSWEDALKDLDSVYKNPELIETMTLTGGELHGD